MQRSKSLMRAGCMVALLCIVFQGLWATPADAGTVQLAIGQLVSTYHANGDFVGNVLVADRNGVVYAGSFGLADRSWNVPNTPRTRFNIASMTKGFTALMTLQLVNEGKLDLGASISRYLPEYRKDTGGVITIDQLLSHRSGLPDYANSYEFYHRDARLAYDRANFIKKFLSGTPEFTPGSQAKYCSTGYWLLGAIIERVTGTSYAQNLRRRIILPLHLANTGYDGDGLIIERRATGYVDGYTYSRVAPYINLDNFFSSAAMYSNTTDLLRWMRAVEGTALLPAHLRKRLFRAYGRDFYQPELSYGYGWEMGKWTIAPGLTVDVREHGGNEPGFRSMITETTGRGYVIIILENSGDGQFSEMTQEITRGIAAIMYGRMPQPARVSLERSMAKSVLHGDLHHALALYESFHASPRYRTDDYALTALTDELVVRGKAHDAAEILKSAVAIQPASSRLQGSLGDAYAALGDRVNAIQAYRKVLLINPRSARATQRLHDLGVSADPQPRISSGP